MTIIVSPLSVFLMGICVFTHTYLTGQRSALPLVILSESTIFCIKLPCKSSSYVYFQRVKHSE